MTQSVISARLDSADKAAFDHFCENAGMSTSIAINIFVKTVLRENCIPFEIAQTPDPFYSEENQAY